MLPGIEENNREYPTVDPRRPAPGRRVPVFGAYRTGPARSVLSAAAVLAVVAATLAVPAAEAHAGPSGSCPWVGSDAPAGLRAAQVLARMTLDEKITMVHGVGRSAYSGRIPGNDRLCIPALKMRDGPVGVGMADTTQLPSATALAASFDPSLAHDYGALVGAESRTKGVDVNLGPTINIVRDPRWGRAFESYSEDPYLTGKMGAADIDGVQSQGVMAQVKHYAVYNQETERDTTSDNAIVDDRTVHEIYTAAFDTVVAESRPSSAMCSYSFVNGVAACENAYLNAILKGEFGFPGFITSDWYGTHSTVDSANAGMDVQMPDDSFFGAMLKRAVQSGQVPRSRLDDMVTRILRQEFRFGLFEHPSPDTPDAVAATPGHLATAQRAAEDGTVLLKNDGLLPLDAGTLRSIAVIGDGAGPNAVTRGGGSATVPGTGVVTPFEGIRARAGAGVDVAYEQGAPTVNGRLPTIDSRYLTPPSGGGTGLLAEYFDNTTLSGAPVATRVDPTVAATWTGASPVPGLGVNNYSVRWTGTLTPPVTGTYTVALTSNDGSRLRIDGSQVIDNWHEAAVFTGVRSARVELAAGRPVPIEVEYYQSSGGAVVDLGWQPPDPDLLARATALAARSDVAVVVANVFETEYLDLTDIDLPGTQNELIGAVAAANPRTVVVLNTGSAVTMPWLDRVAGVFEAWYPGQRSGPAIAALLFGDRNPSAKLPVTFPTSLAQVPAATADRWPGTGGTVRYAEGLHVGYRWYDANGLTPLFPFGYGLSYTTFRLGGLRLSTDSLSGHGRIVASVDVTNTGARPGSEVVQLYLGAPASTGEPPNQLKGFAKVALAPHEHRRVSFTIGARDASYWHPDAHAWTLGTGDYTVRVGTSSRDLPLAASFHVTDATGPRYTTVTAPAAAVPGSTVTVTTTFTNGATGPVRRAHTTLDAPPGWRVRALTATGYGTVPPGQQRTSRWAVTAPAGAAGGPAPLSATTRYEGSDRLPPGTGTTTVKVPYATLAAAFDTIGTSDDADPVAGNLDGWGDSLSAQALASVGITPGRPVDGFTWPDVPAGRPNAVAAKGQIVRQGGSGSSLAFLVAGTYGTARGTVTVTYTDGSVSTGTVTAAAWYANEAAPGCTLVATTPYWNRSGTLLPADVAVSLYSTSIPLSAGRTVAYLTLPENGALRVFATAVR